MAASSLCEDNSAAWDPDRKLTDGISNFNDAPRHVQAWVIAGCFAVVACLLSFTTIIGHLRRWVRPVEQVHVVRILLFVPIYAIISWCSFYWYRYETYYAIIETVYESVVIYSFFALVMAFLGEDMSAQKLALVGKPPMKFPFPLNCFYYKPKSNAFFFGVKVAVLQYTFVRPTLAVVSIIAQAKGNYCAESMQLSHVHVWAMILNTISVTISMFALFTLYLTVREDVHHRHVTAKFMSVKAVIFLTFWQLMVINVLAHFKVIVATDYWTVGNISGGLAAFLVCIEMGVASVVHIFVFSPREYRPTAQIQQGGYVTTKKPAGVCTALAQSLNPSDIGREMWFGLTYFFRRMVYGKDRAMPVAPEEEEEEGGGRKQASTSSHAMTAPARQQQPEMTAANLRPENI
ncbi:organic solute transporter Ostalpha-domain-containing protein [Geranomyces variabilis]|nr:organic solute transporter Ostalpha-domain-containing protein [Geranomyces variabilis]KAJ3136294.1 hypothetical protein HDU90_003346 [Geranomyces variabilis]